MPRLFFALLFLAAAAGLAGQTIADAVERFATRDELRGAQVGIDVIEVNNGRRVASYQPFTALIPASTLKIVTTAAALDILGPDHRFTTRLVYTGRIDAGVLRGDVHIIGGGDPTLGSPYMQGVARMDAVLERWCAAIQRAGIQRIEGRVVGDGSYFPTNGTGPGWPYYDVGNYYGAGAYGLNLNENSYWLDLLQQPQVGSKPKVQGARPRVPGLVVKSELVSGAPGSGDQAYIYAAPGGSEAVVRGSIPAGNKRFTIRGSVPDPALFAANALTNVLEQAGIKTSLPPETDQAVKSVRFGSSTQLDIINSPALVDIIDRTNLRSLNIYAEALLREINKARGLPMHELTSSQAVRDWLQSLGLYTAAVQFEDGSGLDPRSFFPPEFMTGLLRTQAGNTRWRQSLPTAGRTGSMRNFLKKRAAAGRLQAKSGSLNGVRCYAGYAKRADGRELAFSIMVNNHRLEGRRLRNLMLELMDDFFTEQI